MRLLIRSILYLAGLLACSEACHLSNLSLVSVTGTGPYTITVQLCVGAGITGFVRGADDATRTIHFLFYKPGGINVTSFTPAGITGFGGCTMNGLVSGPIVGGIHNEQRRVMYIDPGYYGIAPCLFQPYACNTSTALCGNATSLCTIHTFVTDVCPDSIIVAGVEGDGNPYAGCGINSMTGQWMADMKIDFPCTLLPQQLDLAAQYLPSDEVSLKWDIPVPSPSDEYILQTTRSISDQTNWYTVDELSGDEVGNNTSFTVYDDAPYSGIAYYRIKQIRPDQSSIFSNIVSVVIPEKTEFLVYPNPAKDVLHVQSPSVANIYIFNSVGNLVLRDASHHSNSHEISLETFFPGMYLIHMVDSSGQHYSRKFEVTR